MQKSSITYPHFLDPSSDKLKKALDASNYSSVFVLCDENTQQHCWPLLKRWYPKLFNDEQLIIVGAGETHKSLRTAEFIWSSLLGNGADRYSLLINLGGGMITDLGAFAASLYQRGIDFIQLPTSLLAMVDAAIGGKTGVDLDKLKNLIGTFTQPKAIMIFPDFLNSLDEDEYLSGTAEIYKHALIQDSKLWSELKGISADRLSVELIKKAAQIKANVIEQDPLEGSIRKILNFGHTIGHAVESNFLSFSNPIPHGFAVAVGMICEAFISRSLNGLPEVEFRDIVSVIKAKFPKIEWSEHDELEMIKTVLKDKKNRSGIIKMVLLDSVGNASFDHDVKEELILDALKFYREAC